jgi:hypothetical protein
MIELVCSTMTSASSSTTSSSTYYWCSRLAAYTAVTPLLMLRLFALPSATAALAALPPLLAPWRVFP